MIWIYVIAYTIGMGTMYAFIEDSYIAPAWGVVSVIFWPLTAPMWISYRIARKFR